MPYLMKFQTLDTISGKGKYVVNKSPINLPNTSITNVNIITKANAKVQIIAIIALFINDLFSFYSIGFIYAFNNSPKC